MRFKIEHRETMPIRKQTSVPQFFLKVLVMILLVFGGLQMASAQQEYEDVILLQSAEVLRGQISENVPGGDVSIVLRDGTLRVVPRVEIVKILREPKRISKKVPDTPVATDTPKSTELSSRNGNTSYQGFLGLGFGLIPAEEEYKNVIKLNFINGISLGEGFSIGVGTGARIIPSQDLAAIPLFGDIRLSLPRMKVAPMVAFGAGTLFHPRLDWNLEGRLVYFEMGLRFNGSGKSGVILSVSYENFTVAEPFTRRSFLFSFETFRPKEISAISLNLAFAF